MQSLRTYRLVPALLALSLVLTATTPLVVHACGMTPDEMASNPCCDDQAGHHDAPAMPMHSDMPHGESADAMPCHEAPTPPEPCPDADGPALHDACCQTADAPTAPAPERVELNPTALSALVVAFLQPAPPPPVIQAPPAAESPPRAPIALHLLYGSFLN